MGGEGLGGMRGGGRWDEWEGRRVRRDGRRWKHRIRLTKKILTINFVEVYDEVAQVL